MDNCKIKELGKRFDTREGRAEFIETAEVGIYTGISASGLQVRVHLGKKGMSVYTEQKEKPKWWQVIDYDTDGYQEAIRYEARD